MVQSSPARKGGTHLSTTRLDARPFALDKCRSLLRRGGSKGPSIACLGSCSANICATTPEVYMERYGKREGGREARS